MGLGFLATVVICAIAYYNDFALANTLITGNNLPIGLVLLTFLFVLLVNGPLSRWAPRYALSSGELAVAFSMALVACALPSSGLMRFLPHSIVTPLWHAQSNKEYRDLLLSLHLPEWLFPNFASSDRKTWFSDPIVNGFLARWTGDGAPPYLAWIRPAITWGLFTFGVYGAVMCLMTILRRQWADNERLPFPLVQIQLSLLEAPSAGNFFNTLMRNRLFWVGFGIVCIIHFWNGGGTYAPRSFPRIPIEYYLSNIFANPPWSYVSSAMKSATIYFTVVGISYFLPSAISFSIWGTFIALQGYSMLQGQLSGDASIPGLNDQRLGGIFAFLLVIIWIGRHHWKLVIAQAFRGEREGEPVGRYLSYRTAFWGLVGSIVSMILWLMLAGCDLLGSVVLVVMLLTLFLITARIVAETGLVMTPTMVPLYRPLTFMSMADMPHRPPVETFYMTALVDQHHYSLRETLAVYGSHALRLADQTVYESQAVKAGRSMGRKFLLVLALALGVGYVVSWAGALVTEYNYGASLDRRQVSPINPRAIANVPQVMNATLAYSKDIHNTRHSPAGHFAFGFGLTSFLAYMRLHFVWWPVHPLGYLILGTFAGNMLWFSFFLGWLAKQLIVKYGGQRLYVGARPLFIGLIVGESVAAGGWMAISIILNWLGYVFVDVRVLPA